MPQQHSEYDLTELGHSCLEPMQALVTWADTHHRTIAASRRRYRAQGRVI